MAVMEMDRIAHPEREKLSALAQGRLAADEIEMLEDHLATCESCCLLLEQTHDDSFVGKLRDARELSPLWDHFPSKEGIVMAVMEMDRIAHPEREKLSALAQGRLAADEIEMLEDHLATCESCCLLLEQTHDDSFVGKLRDARELSPLDTFRKTNDAELPSELAEHPRYRLIRLLGRGGMGAVYLADHRRMGRPVALKIINAELLNQHGSLSRFQQEVRTAAKLDHPNIVAAYDADQAGEVHFLVMEYVEGQNLADAVKENGPLTIAQSCDIIRQAALGLQHAHERGMVHRDIKPHNLMRTPAGQVKVLDFGLARIAAEPAERMSKEDASRMPHLTGTGTVMGSADYIAPEQAHDSHAADCRSDIYSLGCTLYYLLTKRPPFPDGTAPEKLKNHRALDPCSLTVLRAEVPGRLAKTVAKMMAKRPEDRYQSAAEVAGALATFCGKPVPKPFRFRPRLLALVALMLATISIAAAAGVVRLDAGDREIVIETDDPAVEVVVKGDRIVRIVDPQSGKAYQLDRNDLTLTLADDPGGLEVVLNGAQPINLKRQGKRIASVRLEAKAPTMPPAAPNAGIWVPPERQIAIDTIIASVDQKEVRQLFARWLNNAKDSQGTPTPTSASQRFEVVADGEGFRKDLQALSDQKKAVQYANPTVVVLNGRPSYIVDGGETPVLTSDSNGTPSVTYKTFGTVINYTPIIRQDGKIELRICPEVSKLNSKVDIKVEGKSPASIPGFDTQTVQGTVLLASGQSVLVSGFKDTGRAGKELIIVTTPRIVDPDPQPARQVQLDVVVAKVKSKEVRQIKRLTDSLASAPSAQFGILENAERFRKELSELCDKNLAKIVEERQVMTISGRPGYIINGGETPVLTTSGKGNPKVTYKTFGTVVNFLPIVLGNGKIHLEVRPELSNINQAAGIQLSSEVDSTFVPGFDVQSGQVAVQMEDGQTLALIGWALKTTVAVNATESKEVEEEVLILVTPRVK